jgi:hypothetical protein
MKGKKNSRVRRSKESNGCSHDELLCYKTRENENERVQTFVKIQKFFFPLQLEPLF